MDTKDDTSTRQDDTQFFFHKLPFVCYKLPFVKPIICLNIPFINNNQYRSGFTLIELIITLTIAGILFALAGPAMQSFVQNQRLSSHANEIIADLNYARSEAIKRGGNVSICRQGGTLTSPSCNSAAQWEAGWVVFTDTDADSTLDAGETVLRVHETLAQNVNLRVIGSVALNSVSFANTGLTTMTTGQEAALRLCDSRGTPSALTISVNYTGRVTTSKSPAPCA